MAKKKYIVHLPLSCLGLHVFTYHIIHDAQWLIVEVGLMRIVHFEAPGAPEVLCIRQAEIPKPKAEEVLIKVHAAGVNRADIFQRQGNYRPPSGASPILGLEVAGTIAALGKDAKPLKN